MTIALTLAGCGAPRSVGGREIVIMVAGAGGHGSGHDRFLAALRDGGVESDFEYFNWGAPLPFFAVNFSNSSVHREAEMKLAKTISSLDRPVSIIAHSAGCGVALGALAKLNDQVKVRRVVLLAPSVSPQYDMSDALRHVDRADLFYSSGDNVFLSWRTGNFGTYDNVKTRAAGNVGLNDAPANLFQHAYDGGHFATLSPSFAKDVIAPLLLSSPDDHSR